MIESWRDHKTNLETALLGREDWPTYLMQRRDCTDSIVFQSAIYDMTQTFHEK